MPRKRMHIEVTGRGNPRHTELKVDGEPVSFVGLNLDWKSFEVPIATVELPYLESDVSADMQLVLNPATVRVLKKMGWIPPIIDDPRTLALDGKSWRVLALILLAAGGRVDIPEDLMVETDFEHLTIEVVMPPEREAVSYRVHRGTRTSGTYITPEPAKPIMKPENL
jgi:hypothetical protein